MFRKKLDNKMCPFIKGDCVGADCQFWTTVRGVSPQGGDIDMPDCAIKWIPMLLIENSKVGRETGAAVESFRNKMVEANHIALAVQAKGLLK